MRTYIPFLFPNAAFVESPLLDFDPLPNRPKPSIWTQTTSSSISLTPPRCNDEKPSATSIWQTTTPYSASV